MLLGPAADLSEIGVQDISANQCRLSGRSYEICATLDYLTEQRDLHHR